MLPPEKSRSATFIRGSEGQKLSGADFFLNSATQTFVSFELQPR